MGGVRLHKCVSQLFVRQDSAGKKTKRTCFPSDILSL